MGPPRVGRIGRVDGFGGRLKAAREQLGLTQEAFAASTGFKISAISAFENGRRDPGLANLVRLADALGVTADQLLGRRQATTKKVARA